jgi:hypothetical protein
MDTVLVGYVDWSKKLKSSSLPTLPVAYRTVREWGYLLRAFGRNPTLTTSLRLRLTFCHIILFHDKVSRSFLLSLRHSLGPSTRTTSPPMYGYVRDYFLYYLRWRAASPTIAVIFLLLFGQFLLCMRCWQQSPTSVTTSFL